MTGCPPKALLLWKQQEVYRLLLRRSSTSIKTQDKKGNKTQDNKNTIIVIVSFSGSVIDKFEQKIKVFVEDVYFMKTLAERCSVLKFSKIAF